MELNHTFSVLPGLPPQMPHVLGQLSFAHSLYMLQAVEPYEAQFPSLSSQGGGGALSKMWLICTNVYKMKVMKEVQN